MSFCVIYIGVKLGFLYLRASMLGPAENPTQGTRCGIKSQSKLLGYKWNSNHSEIMQDCLISKIVRQKFFRRANSIERHNLSSIEPLTTGLPK
jgi:hypothetical protein